MVKVLIIDYDILFLVKLTEELLNHGFIVETARNGIEGMKKVKVFMPEVLITEMVLPEKDGVEVILELKREKQDIIIIAIHGNGLIETDYYLQVAKDLGVDCTFAKPFKIEQLTLYLKELTLKKNKSRFIPSRMEIS